MERYQVILSYDGTEFFGFQRQATNSEGRTVQGVLESALRQIGWQGRSVLAAGRTDAGVHAKGQVVAFDLDWSHSMDALQAAMNANLPPDVAVRSVNRASPDFHPRYDAQARCYCYRIFCQTVRDPLKERYAWRVWPRPDLERLRIAAETLVGSHDFASFGTPPRSGSATIRHVFQADWREEEGFLIFEIIANAFLYRMVRRLVDFQVAIGQAKLEVETLRQLLERGEKELVKGLAPSRGLFLVEVLFEF